MRFVIPALFCLAAGAAGAQDAVWTPAATEGCLANGQDAAARNVCIGLSAAVCMNTPEGSSTAGMTHCLGSEAEYWDGRLTAAYEELYAIEVALDAELAEIGATVPSMSEALSAAQDAWLVYRETACAYEVSQWGNGSGAGPAGANCMMSLTGRQSLMLESRLAQKTAN